MTHTYKLTGMTCSGCEAKVQHFLMNVEGITTVDVNKDTQSADVSMDKHVPLETLQQALGGTNSKYQISAPNHSEMVEETKSWLATYKPILLIFGYITAATFLAQNGSAFNWMMAMRHFMAGFFLTFSFFKLLDLKAFTESYAMYDIIARKIPAWGYVYALLELALGFAFLTDFAPITTNAVTLVVMSISIVGVLKTVLDKKRIQCACLGAIFKLPMSTVTIVEDGLMIAMSAVMLWMML